MFWDGALCAMCEIYYYPNPSIYQGYGIKIHPQIFALIFITYLLLSLCHVVHFGPRNQFLSYLYLWLYTAPLLCCLYVLCKDLQHFSSEHEAAKIHLKLIKAELAGPDGGGLRRGRGSCSMMSSLECPHSVGALPSWRLPAWGWCTMSQLDLLYMVCCVLRDLYRIRHRHRQRQQQQETALIRWVIPSCILCMLSHTFHLHVYCSTFEIFLTAENCCAWVSFFFIEDSLLHPNTQESWDGQVLFGV